MRKVLACAALLFCFAAPTWSQEPQSEPDTTRTRAEQEPDVEFLDSADAYWVTKGFNDTLYYNGGGSVNSVRLERDQWRNDEALKKMQKPLGKIEVKGKSATRPVLKMGGKEVKTP